MIATRIRAAYLASMVAGPLMRIVAMLALLFASLGMVAGSAVANPGAATMAPHHERKADPAVHCAETGAEGRGQTNESPLAGDCISDCALGCAAIPAPDSRMTDPTVGPAAMPPRVLADPLHGKSLGLADPPPRTA